MTGYRSGFVAGDPELVAALKAFRPTVGTAPQEFVQRASIVAWGDEEHVAETRERYRRKRALFLDLFDRKGIRVAGSEATMYLWLEVPGRRELGGLRGAAARARGPGRAWLVPRRSRRGLLPARARAVRGGVRPRGRDPGGGAVTPELAVEIVAALDRGERRVAEQVDGEWVVDVEAKLAILEFFRLRKVEPMQVGGLQFLDKIPVKTDYAERGRARRASGDRALRLVPLGGCRADAGLREHRRLGRAADDGRHVGDGRLVRADRRRRPSLRRRRDRRRPRAAAGEPGRDRGRRLRRLAGDRASKACGSAPAR